MTVQTKVIDFSDTLLENYPDDIKTVVLFLLWRKQFLSMLVPESETPHFTNQPEHIQHEALRRLHDFTCAEIARKCMAGDMQMLYSIAQACAHNDSNVTELCDGLKNIFPAKSQERDVLMTLEHEYKTQLKALTDWNQSIAEKKGLFEELLFTGEFAKALQNIINVWKTQHPDPQKRAQFDEIAENGRVAELLKEMQKLMDTFKSCLGKLSTPEPIPQAPQSLPPTLSTQPETEHGFAAPQEQTKPISSTTKTQPAPAAPSAQPQSKPAPDNLQPTPYNLQPSLPYPPQPLKDILNCLTGVEDVLLECIVDEFKSRWEDEFRKRITIFMEGYRTVEAQLIGAHREKNRGHAKDYGIPVLKRDMNKKAIDYLEQIRHTFHQFIGINPREQDLIQGHSIEIMIRTPEGERESKKVSLFDEHVLQLYPCQDVINGMIEKIKAHRKARFEKITQPVTVWLEDMLKYVKQKMESCSDSKSKDIPQKGHENPTVLVSSDDKDSTLLISAEKLISSTQKFPVREMTNLLNGNPHLRRNKQIRFFLKQPYIQDAFINFAIELLQSRAGMLNGFDDHLSACENVCATLGFSQDQECMNAVAQGYINPLNKMVTHPGSLIQEFTHRVHILKTVFGNKQLTPVIHSALQNSLSILPEQVRPNCQKYLNSQTVSK